jgi:V8-like Glu-specific endopeptidase
MPSCALAVAIASTLVGGTPDPRVAVVQVSSEAGTCTGTYIAPGRVLTAAHCVPETNDVPGAVVIAFAGVDELERGVIASRTVARFDGDLDLAIVTIDVRHIPGSVRPIPLLPAALALTEADVGGAVVLVGFGLEAPPSAARHSGPSTIASIESERVAVVSSPTEARACFGDSGGPLLISRGGVEYVAAVLSSGAADCSGRDHYTRVDAQRGADFVDDAAASGGCTAGPGATIKTFTLAALALALIRRHRRRSRPSPAAPDA